ncbi:XisI protein [Gloeocapsa sp. PCC 7428]|uniref:XisI protein n=1 Tax=Gloeocapsa sp. PCC 7428 TaxID=1173026 RepID=UPI0002A5EA4C|nr:XisI protein [Gloeocapsa sp. PCC 7428]AFZ32997.1 XisI protein [Gloeocapsa sp. PCC 7428]
MDTLAQHQKLIRDLILEHTKIPYANGEVEFVTVFDDEQCRYLLMLVGREPAYGLSLTTTRRVHGCLIHVDIIDGQFWIQRDGTEKGIAADLIKAGISKEQIIMAFRSEDLRHSELSIA